MKNINFLLTGLLLTASLVWTQKVVPVVFTGTQEMLSVPYAMYAAKSSDAAIVGVVGGSSSTNGDTIISSVLRLTPADATNGGIVTTRTHTAK